MTTHRKGRSTRNQLRIIAGQWRSRRLSFPDVPDLRPTADRVRETLFNWLQALVPGAHCLDLYAGSGACGLEALSRGAASVQFVERSRQAAEALSGNLALLGAGDRGRVHCSDVETWLAARSAAPASIDLVFIDPPYASDRMLPVCHALEASGLLAREARIYLETGADLDEEALPPGWQVLRRGRAGKVQYHLCLKSDAVQT